MKVLFCCHGNVNRSPAGETILRSLRPDFEVRSSALKETDGGQITAKKMRESLVEAGYDYMEIRSQPTTDALVEWADVIFLMDVPNREKFEAKWPHALRKTSMIGTMVGVKKIPDPAFAAGTEEHKKVIKLLERALLNWLHALTAEDDR